MADKPISTSLQPSNSGNVMYFFFFFFKFAFLHYETFSFINGATYEG